MLRRDTTAGDGERFAKRFLLVILCALTVIGLLLCVIISNQLGRAAAFGMALFNLCAIIAMLSSQEKSATQKKNDEGDGVQ
jgi:ABC-type transport system involved in multi-copper enzyme maturation permease subunit